MIYLDNAATSFPKPPRVYDEVVNCIKNYGANPGRGTYDMSIRSEAKVMETREKICELFNIKSPFNIIFTSNATQALNIGIKGLLSYHDHVITTVIEHNSVLRPLYSLSQNEVEVSIIGVDKCGYVNIKDIENEIKSNTKLIIINHASNVLGTIQNINKIGEIAHSKGIKFMVDASQSAGSVPIDVEKYHIDLLAFSGHKGLYGIQGIGGLFVREGIHLKNFIEGGTGSESHSMIQPNFMPDKFESGTLNIPGIAGLCEGIKFIRSLGMEKIRKHENELSEYLLEELKKLPYIKSYGGDSQIDRTSVISFNMDNIDASIVGEELNKCEISVRTGYHCAPLIHNIIGTEYAGTVRVSFGYFNTFDDIEKLLESLIRLAQ